MSEIKLNERINNESINKDGCLMKVIMYNSARDIVVEFQDEYKALVHTRYEHFINGDVRNPYSPSIYGVGITGNKYPVHVNGKISKEYGTWTHILQRCFDNKFKLRKLTYQDVACCDEWLYYEKFYEWLHEQENFEKWSQLNNGAVDKDIIVKNNKIYCPENCVLVPTNVNNLFVKPQRINNCYPTGVSYYSRDNNFEAKCCTSGQTKFLGRYSTVEEAFEAYKRFKEDTIKNTAIVEYANGNISKRCYDAMINYCIEITD